MEIAYFCYATLFDVLFRLEVLKVEVGVWAGGHLPSFWNVPCCNQLSALYLESIWCDWHGLE